MEHVAVAPRDPRPAGQRGLVLAARVEHDLLRQHHAALHAGLGVRSGRIFVDQRDGGHAHRREPDQGRLALDAVGQREVERDAPGHLAQDAGHVEPGELVLAEGSHHESGFVPEDLAQFAAGVQQHDDEVTAAVELAREVPAEDGGACPARLVAGQQHGRELRVEGAPSGPDVGLGVEGGDPPLGPPVTGVVHQQADVGRGHVAVHIGVDGRVKEGVGPDASPLALDHVMKGRGVVADGAEPGGQAIGGRVEQPGVEEPEALRIRHHFARREALVDGPDRRLPIAGGVAPAPCGASAQSLHDPAHGPGDPPRGRPQQRGHAFAQFPVLRVERRQAVRESLRLPRVRAHPGRAVLVGVVGVHRPCRNGKGGQWASSFRAASWTRGSLAATTAPPPCASSPAQVVTTPPAPFTMGISAAMS